MNRADKVSVVNIRELITNDSLKPGEKTLPEILSGFSCPQNPDVEHFLKKNAIEFTKKNQSVTYMILNFENGDLLGYFTLAMKPLTIRGDLISNTGKKKLARISKVDEQLNTYTMAAYLIAQLSKNFAGEASSQITGKDILDLAIERLLQAQYLCGGVVTFLEANNEEKLLSFYDQNLFRRFDSRHKALADGEQHEYVQLMRLF
ncbi:MAG: GNAT family acetyltransferase [Lachnospiraceae bacterium]|nr:GNAT family acetyltransferase [Lachnospiraceae bacterium]